MSQDKRPMVTRNFMKQLSRGAVKSIPLGGALLEQVIYGTLDGEAAQEEAAKLHSALSKISQELEGQDATLGDVLAALQNQAEFTQEMVAEVDKLTALLKDPDHAPISEKLEGAVERVIEQNAEQTETLKGGMNEIVALLNRLIEKVGRDTGVEPRRTYDDKRLLDEYLKDVVAATYRIDIQGIYSMSGAGRRLIYFPIEEHYTPLKSMRSLPGVEEAAIAVSQADSAEGRAPLTGLLSSHRRLLIIGEPGGGKTTFLRLIACVLAKDSLGQDEPGRKLHLGLSLKTPPPVPILIRVSVLAGTLRAGGVQTNGAGLWRVLLQSMEELFGKERAALLQRLLDDRRCALLLDGLDEEADLNLRKQIVDVTNAVLHHWGQNLIVLSSRPFGYHAFSALEEMATVHIDAFGKEEILEFLHRWADALFPDEEERSREAYLPELESAVLNIPPIRRMARNPVMLTCLCVVHWNEKRLPEGKADLLAAVLRWLLNAKEEKRKARGYNNTFTEECFKALALAMADHPKGKQANADLAWAAQQLEVPFRDELGVEGARLLRKGMDFLEAEMLDSGVVEQAMTGQLRFWHSTFQEHYSARALVELRDGDGPDGWWQAVAPHLDDRQWDEVLDHFAGCLAGTGRMRLNLLVERVLGTATTADLASIARAVGILGRILRILVVYDYQPPARLGWENARKQVMDIFTPEGASRVPIGQRIAAAEALGQAGDPRINHLAPEMLPIPGIRNVLLGKYPVTVGEYQRFVQDKGYEDARYWEEWWSTKEDKGWSEPARWDEQKEHLNRPVTGVSWYEAAAYCNWLAIQTGLAFGLPKSEDWGKAAANPKGGYPWGNDDPDRELCNLGYYVGSPTPVGVYPAGGAPGGHLDIAGNVWEWTADLSEKGGPYRVMRGGSWGFDARFCRSAFRSGDPPGIRNYYVGFRLSRSLP